MHISEYLESNSISVAQFSKMIGAGAAATVYRYINGRCPKPEMLQRIIKVTKGQVTANDFFKIRTLPKSRVSETTSTVNTV